MSSHLVIDSFAGRRAYYNEVDPYAAAWIRNLIATGLVAPGDVDERDIRDVRPSDLAGYTRCHFFAGIGVWDYALGLAGWPAHRPVWTGSCPCQPFSTAGRGDGFADERHLWPSWFHLIRECGPAVVFGEQVASTDGLAWLDLVSADLESAGYAFAAADLPAAGVGAPHIRQRSWFVAHAAERGSWARDRQPGAGSRPQEPLGGCGFPGRLVDADFLKRQWGSSAGREAGDWSEQRGQTGLLAHADAHGRAPAPGAGLHDPEHNPEPLRLVGHPGSPGLSARERQELLGAGRWQEGRAAQQPGRSFWSDAEWIPCRDGKARPVEPGTFPLAHGAPARVGRLRAYGNAIVAQVAAEFIATVLDLSAGYATAPGADLPLFAAE
ncbi:C-5 cytosine-specific DNA methylase [Methylobacterium nodulans ORS 2060]|uniref:C-5 cytosine-specific DNA methylase n=1 Tax=Methylobacterium nodulans (strain LMG 21967 / CNCM I-2342 / ORS 2060) TaxID=460265 RepID=B8INY7_METNO|nr:C-5 cytosine-specific DNA methylase [Methylobacterium nodulans ORS 2060]